MSTIFYLHGFLSSPQSYKAIYTANWLQANRPDIQFVCPQLSSYPKQCEDFLIQEIKKYPTDELFLIGSSLGGFWANVLIERSLSQKAVLINPAVNPGGRFKDLIGQTLEHYYSEDTITLEKSDIDYLIQCEAGEPKNPKQYWTMLQTGDETLDYRLAESKYKNCKLLVEDGGNHSFEGYDNWLPKIIEFFETELI